VDRLTQTVDRLTKALEAATRSGKRQAAPFSKGEPRPDPKKPGRKPGDAYGEHRRLSPPPESEITERHRAELPPQCPQCESPDLKPAGSVVQYQVDLPVAPIWRKFEIERGTCAGCGAAIQGRHALQTSDAIGAAGVQLGPNAQAAVTFLNKTCGLSHGKVRRVMRELFRIPLSRGGSARIVLRVGRRCESLNAQIQEAVRGSPRVRADETGWRIGGKLAWLHALVGDTATAYLIRRSRGAEVPAEVLGFDWTGTLLSDGWAPYQKFTQAVLAQCVRHMIVRVQEMIQVARGGAVRFPRQVLAILNEALRKRKELHEAHEPAHSGRRNEAYDAFNERLVPLLLRRKHHAGNERLARHLRGHFLEWFQFLLDPDLEAANWPGEQAVRQAVVNRKVWGGSRTDLGARAQSILMSVLETCRRQDVNPLHYLAQLLCGHSPRLLPEAA